MKTLHSLFFLVLVLLLGCLPVSAWDSITHEWFAKKICEDFDCSCETNIVAGSVIPINKFKDAYRRFCYNLTDACLSPGWSCPAERDCPAYEQMDNWLGVAQKKTGCPSWYNVGIAGNYYLDSQEFFRQVSGEKQDECAVPFEQSVGRLLELGQENWTVCKCGICTTYSDFQGYVRKYADSLDFMVRSGQYDPKRVIVVSNSIDRELAEDLFSVIRGTGFEVINVGVSGLPEFKNERHIIFLGGHRSPEGVGELVADILDDKEKKLLLADRSASRLFVKTNVYHPGQAVYIFAGYEKEQTRLSWLVKKDWMIERLRGAVEIVDCIRDADCGEPFYEGFSCKDETLVRTLNKPKCLKNECKIQIELENVERCTAGKYCVPGEPRCFWRTKEGSIV
ncbi:MAG: hypothetical protein ABH950_07475 [Candidatus Altiarchaeota archaeon]